MLISQEQKSTSNNVNLYILLQKVYYKYKESLKPGTIANSLDDWCAKQKQEIPQVFFRYTTLHLQILFCFIRSLRESNFALYIDSLPELTPCVFFSLDHNNYARLAPIHIRDMMKSDLIDCLERRCSTETKMPETDVMILDGAVLVNILKPIGEKTFTD